MPRKLSSEMTPEEHKEKHEAKLARAREYKANNREKMRADRARYHAENKDRCNAVSREYRKNKTESTIAAKISGGRKYWRENSERINARRRTEEFKERRNEQQRLRYSKDMAYMTEKRLRASLSQAIRKSGARKTTRTFALVGCSVQDLVKHIESLFYDGMNWERRAEIDIDHIVPVSSFDMACVEEQRKCFHYTNLRPLWKKDNMAKGSKIPLMADLRRAI